ncbi:homeobox protein engrailed-1-like [Homarus americanus]|uniref:homeobox protein engrailed-1-like n=1 Tax=Homarus americanus TaxID=6706 RepID=UPI001C483FC8|nr:homeobox protein engrailed-1-like [Homarus americanus]
MCDTSETMDTRSEPSQGTDGEGEDDISVGSHSPLPPPRDDTDDDSMIDVDDSANDDPRGDKVAASPKVEPPDPAMSPGPPRTPPVAHQANNAALHRSLKFSIDNILKPDFGRRLGETLETSDQPVDLSRVTNRDPKKAGGFRDPARSPGDVGQAPNSLLLKDREGSGGTLWPAWVYCTRYSDRPSAGMY